MSPHAQPVPVRRWSLRRKLSIAFACFVMTSVAVFSFLPTRDKNLLHTRGRFHSWGHVLVFTVVSYVATSTTRSLRARVLLFVVCLLFGIGIEFGEHLVYHSALERKDMLCDGIGVVLGALLALASVPREVND